MNEFRKYEKIEPEKRHLPWLYSPLAGILVGTALSVFGANFVEANYLLGKGIPPEAINRPARIQTKTDLVMNRILIQNPISKAGRDLAYFLNKKE